MMKNRRFLNLSCTILSVLLLSAAVQAKSTLWKARSPKGTLYIQGSVHLLKASDYPLATEIEEAYSQCDALILEVDMMEMLDPETQQLILSKAMQSKNQTLESSLSPAVYKELCGHLDEAGIHPLAMQQFKPWYVALTLVMSKMQAMGFDPGLGLDQHFFNKATADKKKVIGLETARFHIELFDSLAEGNQDAYMKHMLQEMGLFETQLTNIMKAWKAGDADTLGRLLNESFEEFPELYESFVVKRNRAWAKKLEKLTTPKKSYMVVVGAAHLPGEKGLLNLLKKRGYSLEQL